MSMIEEQLFGAPLGEITGLTVSVHWRQAGFGSVVVMATQANRRQMLTLDVIFRSKDQFTGIVAHTIPLQQRSLYMSVKACRRMMWAMHKWCGENGYEVRIANCGGMPRK